MKTQHYTPAEANEMEFGTKSIRKYPTPTKDFDIALMKVNGRHPEGEKRAYESDCNFAMYITKGQGTVVVGDEEFNVNEEDVVFVGVGDGFYVEGEFEYVTFVSPAWYPEQYEER